MIVTPVRTDPVTDTDNLSAFVTTHLPPITDRMIVVVTSKVVSILEGNIISKNAADKKKLIRQEADWYIDSSTSRYDVTLTRKNGVLIASSGIDESNGNGNYILWPKDPFASAAQLWTHLREHYHLDNVGVLITDSRTIPLRWGVLGLGVAWCGFEPLNSYIGKPDIFGKPLKMTKQSVLDGLAAAAVLVMGEGNEQTPLATISEIPFVTFADHPPTFNDIQATEIEPEDDLFAPLLQNASWKKKEETSA